MAVTSARGFKTHSTNSDRFVCAARRHMERFVPRSSRMRAMASLPAIGRCRCLMAGLELRAAKGGKGPGTVVGYAAVFEKFSQDLGGFIEKIQQGAFAGVLSSDVRALKNHDSNYLLGRSKSRHAPHGRGRAGPPRGDRPPRYPDRPRHRRGDRPRRHGRDELQLHHGRRTSGTTRARPRSARSSRSASSMTSGPSPSRHTPTPRPPCGHLERPQATSLPQPATAPAFDPLSLFQFRLQVEQARVLPATED